MQKFISKRTSDKPVSEVPNHTADLSIEWDKKVKKPQINKMFNMFTSYSATISKGSSKKQLPYKPFASAVGQTALFLHNAPTVRLRKGLVNPCIFRDKKEIERKQNGNTRRFVTNQ